MKSYFIASELLAGKGLAILFLRIVERTEKSVANALVFSSLTPQNSIDQRFAVKNSGVSCLTSIFYFSNPKVKIQHTNNWFKKARYDN